MRSISVSRVWCPALAVFLAVSLPACSGDQETDPDLVADKDADLAEGADGNLTKAEKPKAKKTAADDSGNSDGEGEGEGEGEGKTAKSSKEPIADDGYDDDWNNMGSQQQQKNNANNKGNQTGNNGQAEPPVQDEPLNGKKEANAPAEAPPEQTPPAEPVLDTEPAPVADVPAPPAPPAPPPPAVPPAPKALTAGPPLIKGDVEPETAHLFWVGYDYLEKAGLVRIEMVTRGSPKFNLFQERNKANQPELVVRFFNTKLRPKLRRDIDASEFRSPVAYVRLRPDEAEGSVDVVLTLRDEVQPRMYTKLGNVMLTFPVPDRYFGNSAIGTAPVAKAEVLPNANVMPDLDQGSELPEGLKVAKAFVNNPGADAFKNAPEGGGPVAAPPPAPPAAPAVPVNAAAMPADFSAADAAPPAPNSANAAPPANANAGPAAVNASAPAPDAGSDLFTGANAGEGAGDDLDFGGKGGADAGANAGANGAGEGAGEGAGDGAGDGGGNSGAKGSGTGASDKEELEDDKLDDFDNGKGESPAEIDKFDVGRQDPARPAESVPSSPTGRAGVALVVSAFTVAGVAADDDNGGNTPASGGGDDFGGDDPPADAGLGNGGGGNAAAGGGNAAAGGGNVAAGGGNAVSDFPAAGNQAAGPTNGGGNGNLLGPGGGNAAPAAANAAPAAANAAPPPANAALGAGNTVGANAAAAAGAAANAAPVGLVPTATVQDNGGAAPGEPPVAGAPDLAGKESEGAETEAGPQPAGDRGRPVKLDFRGAPLTEVVRALSEESHVNFIMPPAVGATPIYLNLNGVPFNDALRAVLEANALGMVPVGPNLVRIDTLDKLAGDKELQERRRKADLKLRPTKILVHRLSYALAADAAKMLGDMLGAASKEDNRITVQVDARTNSVIVNAPPSELATVKALLERVDLETPQVKIASRVIEVVKNFNDSFGISWGTPFNVDQGRGLGFGNLVFPNYMLSRYSVDAGGTAAQSGNFQFRFGSINNVLGLDLALAMQEQRAAIETLQSSDVVVEDNVKAKIIAGQTDYFQPPATVGGGAGAAAPTLLQVDYNLSMEVTPHITADGAVQMKVIIESDSPLAAKGPSASKTTRHLDSSMLRRSGETAVIGGVFTNEKTNSQTGVPFFSSLPIIGALFRQSIKTENKKELMVMITPTILTNSKAFANDGDGGTGGEASAAPTAGAAQAALKNAGGDDFSDSGLDGDDSAAGGGNGNFGGSAKNAGANSGGNNNGGGNAGGGNNNGGGNNAGGNNAGGNNAGGGDDDAGTSGNNNGGSGDDE